MNFLIQELKKKKRKMISYWIDFWATKECSQRNFESSSSIAILVVNQKLRHCFQITRTHMSSLMHFFAKDNCHFHSFDHSLELCLAAKISNHKRAKFLKTQHFLNFQWFKCTTRFTFSALILVSLQKALT